MTSTVRKLGIMQPCLEYGTVIDIVNGRTFLVETGFGRMEAERAVGCLVNPALGDTVLICLDNTGEAFILSVLRQSSSRTGMELLLDGNVDLRVHGGRLAMSADDELSIASGRRISMAARRMAIHADQGEAVVGKFSFLATSLKAEVKRLRTVADSVEQLFRRLTQRMQDKFSFIQEQHEVQAGSVRYITEETLTMQSKNAVHMAEEVVTINGDQIHMG